MKNELLTMYSPLSAVIRREPVTVQLDTPVREAIGVMDKMRIGSVIIAEPQLRLPLGIFTLRDLLHRVSLQGNDLDQPIANVMTSGLITVKPQTTAYQAAVLMARHDVRHLIVVDGEDRLLGIVSQNDLFALQRVAIKDVSGDIRAARDIGALKDSAADIRRIAENLVQQGISAEQLTHYVSTLNDLLTLRIIELVHDEFELPPVRWCWIALGSEGRFEQTLSTDQDNGIIFEPAGGAQDDELRNAFLPFAREVNRKLDACGFPLCKGNIMAGNAQWCLSQEEWRAQFSNWIHVPEPEALLNAAIFFDFRPLYGDTELSDDLREWLCDAAAANSMFQRHMAENALKCQPPLGMIRDFVYDKPREFPHTIDLKTFGSRPFVDAARILALVHGIPHTSTAERLRAVAQREHFASDDMAAIIDGFFFILTLRLRKQRELQGVHTGANRIDPSRLNELDRQILKEAFKQARKLQLRLKLDFRL